MHEHERSMMTIPFSKDGIPIYRSCLKDKKGPALIVVHEVWGIDKHIKSVADRFCEQEYQVIVPDLFTHTKMEDHIDPRLQKIIFDPEKRKTHQTEIRAMWAPMASPDFSKLVIRKLKTVFKYLDSMPTITKIGVAGFCFGGTYSFGLAVNEPKLSAAVPFYGHGEQFIDEFKKINSPILAFYGEKDTALTNYLPEIDKTMNKANVDFSSVVFPNAGHAFFNNTNELTYNQPAAEDSWRMAVEFLDKHLK